MPYRNLGYHPEETRAFPVPVVSMWHRFAAYFVDSALITFIAVGLFVLGFLITADDNPNASWERLFTEFDATMIVLNGASVVITAVYYIGCWTLGGQTLGKLLLNIRVVGDDNKPPSLAAAVIRYLGFFINNLISLGFLAIAFDKRKQGWHDKMAHTFVVRADVEVPLGAEPVFIYPSDSNTADVMGVWLYVFSVCILPCIVVFAIGAIAPEMLRQLDPALVP